DLVLAELGELRPDLEAVHVALVDLMLQDLTGLVGAPSGGRLLPPEEALRDPAPFRVVRERRRERTRVALVQGLDRGFEPVDHRSPSIAPTAPAHFVVRAAGMASEPPSCSTASRST